MLFLVAISVLLAVLIVRQDATEGLDYTSGDSPEEAGRSICSWETGPCPPSGFEWRIPASGVIETRFQRDDIDDRTEFRGWFRLEAFEFVQEEMLDCPAVVDWSLLVDSQPVAQGTIKAGGEDQAVTGTPPREAMVVVLTARRTDSLACHSTLQWIHAGLD
jgi:hypothetical protein